MKKLLIALMLGAVCCGTAIADDWTYISTTSTAKMYMGEPSRSGNRVRVWKMAEYLSPIKKDIKDHEGRHTTKWVKQRVSLLEMDCRRDRWKLLRVIKYFTDGTYSDKDIENPYWQQIEPDTFGERAIDYACD